MADKLGEFLIELLGSPYLAIIFVSMFPLIELKGAIPVGMTEAFGLGLLETAAMAYIGSTVVCVLVFFLLKPIFKLLKKIKIFNLAVRKLEGLFVYKAAKIAAKSEGKDTATEAKKIMIIALLIFVAVPFPVTGIWTGTAIAVFLSFKFREAILPLALGNLIAGSIITLMTFLFSDYVDIIIYVLFALAILMLIYTVYKIAKAKPTDE